MDPSSIRPCQRQNTISVQEEASSPCDKSRFIIQSKTIIAVGGIILCAVNSQSWERIERLYRGLRRILDYLEDSVPVAVSEGKVPSWLDTRIKEGHRSRRVIPPSSSRQ